MAQRGDVVAHLKVKYKKQNQSRCNIVFCALVK